MRFSSKSPSVCITGGAGFIGSHLAEELIENSQVYVYDDFSSGSVTNLPDKLNVIEDDLRNTNCLAEVVEDVDVVFHQAAQVSVSNSIDDPVKSHSINLDPLLTILETARHSDTRVVFASSAAIYGEPENIPISESHPKNPTSPYGLEKLAADHYCRLYHDLYDVDTVALRYFNVYGARQQAGDYSGVIPIFREQALNDEPITVEGDGTQTRDFVHVSDIVQANLLAATEESAVGQAFNIGTGTEFTIRELAETIKEITDSDSEIVHVDGREGDISKSVADISHARKILGYDPSYRISNGLKSYLSD